MKLMQIWQCTKYFYISKYFQSKSQWEKSKRSTLLPCDKSYKVFPSFHQTTAKKLHSKTVVLAVVSPINQSTAKTTEMLYKFSSQTTALNYRLLTEEDVSGPRRTRSVSPKCFLFITIRIKRGDLCITLKLYYGGYCHCRCLLEIIPRSFVWDIKCQTASLCRLTDLNTGILSSEWLIYWSQTWKLPSWHWLRGWVYLVKLLRGVIFWLPSEETYNFMPF